jgi:hypothetical protein
MKSLKALVIGMGLLIVIGLALLGYGLYRNMGHSPSSKAGSSGPGDAGRAYFSVDLPVAAGNRLEQMAVAGDKVILRFSGSDGEKILVLDPVTGQVTGTIALIPSKP